VEVHRGLPSQNYDEIGYVANQRQAAAWRAESQVVVPKLRPMRYRKKRNQPPTEKGVDVALAVSAIEATLTGRCDVAVVFSHDTDHVETASWTSSAFKQRLQPKAPVTHHRVTQQIFEAVETPINYARRRAG